ncbi:hypothetical protein GCM10028857_18320 [Salinarchaeum chitinilyticum]
MTFLDSSAIIDMLDGVSDTVECIEAHGTPYLTSSICIFEVLEGTLGSGTTNVMAARQQFGGVRAIEFNEDIAIEAARLQDALLADGEPMAPRDLMIAATARTTGDHLVVNDADFQTTVIEEAIPVTNLAE